MIVPHLFSFSVLCLIDLFIFVLCLVPSGAKDFTLFCLSNLLSVIVSDEGYS